VKSTPYFKHPHLKKCVNLPAVLPSHPIDTAVIDRVIIAEVQEEEDKQTPDREDQTKLIEKDPHDFFQP
jgi:hypothetical protein